MGYRDHLWRMLEPLGVYGGEGYSGGELAALGAEMDRLREALDCHLREMPVVTAEGEGLSQAEKLFSLKPAGETDSRRENLRKLYCTDHRAFTKAALTETLGACGIPVTLTMGEEAFAVTVELGNTMTMEGDPVWVMETLERVLPCHLMVEVVYRYTNSETGETVSGEGSLKTLRTWTRSQWEELLGVNSEA